MNSYDYELDEDYCPVFLPDNLSDEEIEDMRRKDEEDSVPTPAERNPSLTWLSLKSNKPSIQVAEYFGTIKAMK